MNKIIFSLLLLTFLVSNSIQVIANQEEFNLKGYMGVQGGESFNYNLQLRDSSDHYLVGYGFTYNDPNKDVKTSVTAIINRAEKTLYIQEKNIIHNRGFKSKAVICLVESRLSLDEKSNNLTGTLITRTSDNGLTCGRGSLSFNNTEEINRIFAERTVAEEAANVKNSSPGVNPNRKLHAHFQQQKQREEVILRQRKAQQNQNKSEKPSTQTITEGKSGSYKWKSDKIILNLWDGGTVDNDKVTILYNGQVVLENYTLKKEKKELILPIGGNELNIISIVAINEGNEPPSTANISIEDNGQIYLIVAHNRVGKNSLIEIRKEKE